MKIEKAGVPEHRWGQRPLFRTTKHPLRWKPNERASFRVFTAEDESYLDIDDLSEDWEALLENDEMQPKEAAFMHGWDEAL